MLHKLIVFDNRVLRKMFVPNRKEMTGGWRELHTDEIHNFSSSPNVRRMVKLWRLRWAGNVARMGEMRDVYKIFVQKYERKPFG
jgi:hypothetical protein